MIRFAYFGSMDDGDYHWSDLVGVIRQLYPGSDIYDREWVELLRTVEKQLGCCVVDEEGSRVTLYFDPPEKELIFKLKYL